MLSCNTTSSIFQSLSTTSRYCLYKQALSLNGLIIKMNYQPINVKSMRSTTRNERTLEKMDCSECNQDIRENLLLKWNYQDLLKDIGKKSNAHKLWFWLRLRGIKNMGVSELSAADVSQVFVAKSPRQIAATKMVTAADSSGCWGSFSKWTTTIPSTRPKN